MDLSTPTTASEWEIGQWFNSHRPLALDDLRGHVIASHAFQMLYPGCAQHGIPEAQRIARTFDPGQVAVVGLHTVFEHHEAMLPVALAAYLHEYRVTLPIGVDLPAADGLIPRTMAAYEKQGSLTPILGNPCAGKRLEPRMICASARKLPSCGTGAHR